MLAAQRLVEVLQDITHSIKAKACLLQSLLDRLTARVKFDRLAGSPVCGREVKVQNFRTHANPIFTCCINISQE
jgi:hypothetical protein